MPKPLPASEKVMVEYLKELLTEDLDQDLRSSVVLKPVEKLLSTVGEQEQIKHEAEGYLEQLEQKYKIKEQIAEEQKAKEEAEKLSEYANKAKAKPYREGSFQALFFDVAGLTVAVPLIELGGIHNITKISTLLGKPDWFSGVMLHKEDQFNVVDTAKWVMPEKYDENLKNSLNYQYIILLNESKWGLCAEKLVNTVTLEQDDVKWRDNPGKRPWLAGLVKERMCALIDVDSMISLLDKGMGVHQQEL